MALSWDVTRCEDGDALLWEPQYDTTVAMVFACLFIDMQEISDKTYQEFYARVSLWEEALGKIRGEKYGPLTLEEVKRYIGLRTNVLTKSRKDFEKRFGNVAMAQRMAKTREMDK